MKKGCYIKEIQDGQQVEGLFLVKEMNRSETRAGKPYLMLTVMDRSGEMAGRIWENADQAVKECPAGGFVLLAAQAQAYKGVLQLKINQVAAVDGEAVDTAEFFPAARGDIEAMAAELLGLIKTITDPHLAGLLRTIFKNKPFFSRFKKAPAAKSMHHACFGGLLEHTLGVSRLAVQVSALYPAIDRSLLLAGALLHDLGKVTEFTFDIYPFNYSDQGRLVGHMVLGVEMVQAAIEKVPGFPEDLATRLKHLILSHHGKHEFGSPTLPMMLEAFVLNFLDDLDAKINYLNRLSEDGQEGYHWTEYQRTMERFLYVSGAPDAETPPDAGRRKDGEEAKETADPRQPSLWNQ